MKKHNIVFSLGILFVFFIGINGFSQESRADIEDKYKWDLTGIYETEEDWRAAKEKLVAELSKIESYKGKLTRSSSDLLACYDLFSTLNKEAARIYIYAGMHSDLDTRDMKYSGMKKEVQQLFSDFGVKAAFVNPEILSVEWSVIERFIAEEPKLKVYEKGLKDLFRQQEHTLSEAEERILALSSNVTGISQSIYSTYTNAEMINPEITLSTGEKAVLSSAGYSKHRAAPDRDDRQLVFEEFWDNYKLYKATFGEMLYGQVKSRLFYSKARNYESSLEASLYPNDIPVEVYHSLIENVNKNLPAFHRYLKIKKRMLGVDTLKYLDLYASVVKGIDLKYSYDEAQDIILTSLKPLGDEYVSTVKKAFSERWIDVYPTTGKRSGAYSQGAFYDGHPYILLNYNGLYSDVGTTTHELGHTMHSYYSNKTQAYPISRYTTFVAEVASIFNEVLLFEHMIKTIKDDDIKLTLLMQRLDNFKGTLFRQTQFAEFELKIHETAQAGTPLTGDVLSEIYKDIVDRYYGHENGICHVDDYINMEWAWVPHFYYNFYLYMYSTSFVACNTLAEDVLNKEKGALERYIAFISSGGSDYPIDQLKDAGVDMTSPEAFGKTIDAMNRVMDEIEKMLDKKGM